MFELLSEDNRARRGILKTRHGNINTPAFMPVGTAATVKGVFTKDLIKYFEQKLLKKLQAIICPKIQSRMNISTHYLTL